MTADERASLARTGERWAANPVVIWTVGIVLAVVAARLFLPSTFDWIKKGVTNAFDGLLSFAADIMGRPGSQDPNKRQAIDSVRGLAVVGDRAASDLVDGQDGGNLTDYAKARRAALIQQGVLNTDGTPRKTSS